MKTASLVIATALLTTAFLEIGRSQTKKVEKSKSQYRKIHLSKNPKRIVFEFARQDNNPDPFLRIYSDGRVVAGKTAERFQKAEYKLSKAKLGELFQYLVLDQKVHKLNSEQFKRLSKNQEFPDSGIATYWKWQIHTKKISSNSKVDSPNQFRLMKKQPSHVKQMLAMEKKVRLLHATAIIGGEKKLQKLLKQINRQMEKKFQTKFQFTSNHIESATALKDGKRIFSLRVKPGETDGFYSVDCFISKEGRFQISSMIDLNKMID